MIKKIITNRKLHQKNIFRLSKSKSQYNQSLNEMKNQNNKSDNKKTEFIYSNR